MRSLKVVQAVRSDTFAGVERYVSEVAAALSSLGHEVVVVGGDPAAMRAAMPPAVEHRAAETTAQVAGELARCGRPDIVHAHMSAAELAAVATRPVHRAPVVATRHFASRRGGSPLSRAVMRTVARGLALEISISNFVADASGPGSVVLYNGVRDQPEGHDRERTVLIMQRLEPEKDTATAVRAFAASGLQEQGWRLQVAGRGSQRDEVCALAAKLGVTVELLGFVSDPQSLLASAGLLVAPAPAEPFGLTVVEAMATGLPVVASRGGAHVETVAADGLLFPPYDVEACAAALRRLAGDLPGRVRAGAGLRLRQQGLFSLSYHVAVLVVEYGARAGR